MTRWLARLALPAAAAILALVLLQTTAPAYLLHQGFPLDDAWIHAVYARELARSGMLAYNPGVPATGETAPLWAFVLAPAHLLTSTTMSAVVASKLLGFLLHLAATCLLASAIAQKSPSAEATVWSGAAIATLHPDLVSASVSGMEVPLAGLTIAAVLWCVGRESYVGTAVAAAAATLSRPEAVVAAMALPFLVLVRARPADALKYTVAALVGALGAMTALGFRNLAVSGMFLPATFHAKVGAAPRLYLSSQQQGFESVMGFFPLLDFPSILIVILIISIVLVVARTTGAAERAAGAVCLTGLLFCAVSFALIRPNDPPAFYFQRYVLPGVALIVGALPAVILAPAARLPPVWMTSIRAALILVMAVLLLRASPAQYRHLANDAQNIDDVQVAFGRALASATPGQNAWIVDAGAPRFFGNAFVVDLMGLNTPEILQHAQAYLDSRPPSYLDLFKGWTTIESEQALAEQSFQTTTPYTVTSSQAMHQHVLVRCQPAGVRGVVRMMRGHYAFRCAS